VWSLAEALRLLRYEQGGLVGAMAELIRRVASGALSGLPEPLKARVLEVDRREVLRYTLHDRNELYRRAFGHPTSDGRGLGDRFERLLAEGPRAELLASLSSTAKGSDVSLVADLSRTFGELLSILSAPETLDALGAKDLQSAIAALSGAARASARPRAPGPRPRHPTRVVVIEGPHVG